MERYMKYYIHLNKQQNMFTMCVYMCVVLFVSVIMVSAEGGLFVTHIGKEYFFSNNSTTWNSSLEICRGMGTLASIGDSGEHNFISEKIVKFSNRDNEYFEYWIGLTIKSGGTACDNNNMDLDCFHGDHEHPCCKARLQWTWTDSTEMNFMKWMINEPSNPHTCGRIANSSVSKSALRPTNFSEGYYWFETSCTDRHRYICKRTLHTSTITSLSTSPTSSTRNSKIPSSSSATAVAAGVAVAVCFLIAAAILFAACIIRRRRREKQALAKTHVTIVPVDSPHTLSALEHDSKKDGRAYINNNTPKATRGSNAKGSDYSNNNTAKTESTYDPVVQTMYADIKFSPAQRTHEIPQGVGADEPHLQPQVEYADLSFENNHTDSYAEVQTQQGVMEYARAYDVTAVQSPSLTDTYAIIPKLAKPRLAVKPQPQNTQHKDKEPTTPSPPDVETELPPYAVFMKKKKSYPA